MCAVGYNVPAQFESKAFVQIRMFWKCFIDVDFDHTVSGNGGGFLIEAALDVDAVLN